MLFLTFLPFLLAGFTPPEAPANPLEVYDAEWKNPKYAACNTAQQVKYLSATEKEVIYVLNLVRQYPQLFNKTVVAKWPARVGEEYLATNLYYTSLVTLLEKMPAAGLLTADSLAWISAKCHAISSGENGYTGHDRQNETCTRLKHYWAECCQYGYNNALEIVMNLLIDENVSSLGHRITCLSNNYKAVGISLKPHSGYRYNTVLDFTY